MLLPLACFLWGMFCAKTFTSTKIGLVLTIVGAVAISYLDKI